MTARFSTLAGAACILLASSAAAQGNIKTALAIKDVNGCKGPDDQPETALQGQVPAALRQAAAQSRHERN